MSSQDLSPPFFSLFLDLPPFFATVFVTPHTGKKTSQLYNLFRARS